jgi:hypothetical protein
MATDKKANKRRIKRSTKNPIGKGKVIFNVLSFWLRIMYIVGKFIKKLGYL